MDLEVSWWSRVCGGGEVSCLVGSAVWSGLGVESSWWDRQYGGDLSGGIGGVEVIWWDRR